MEHINYHLHPNQFDCSVCGLNCKSRILLKIHKKQHVPEKQRMFRCKQCTQSFVLASQLKHHEKTHYTDEEKSFLCTDCGKTFAFKFVLDKHKQHIHIREKNYICEICARSFVDQVNLNAHKKTHDAAMPRLQCHKCDAQLKNKVTLKIHMRVHNPSAHPCRLCDKILATRNALLNHLQYMHTKKKFECAVCFRCFKKPLVLKEHMCIHTGDVLYNCKHCGKKFNAKANMYAHIKKAYPQEWAAIARKQKSDTTA